MVPNTNTIKYNVHKIQEFIGRGLLETRQKRSNIFDSHFDTELKYEIPEYTQRFLEVPFLLLSTMILLGLNR